MKSAFHLNMDFSGVWWSKAVDGVMKIYTELKETGKTTFPDLREKRVRTTIEELIWLPGYYKIEETTTEASRPFRM